MRIVKIAFGTNCIPQPPPTAPNKAKNRRISARLFVLLRVSLSEHGITIKIRFFSEK